MVAFREEIFPKRSYGNALADGVGRHERATNRRALDEVDGFLVPARHVVEITVTIDARKNFCHISLLFTRLKALADEGRIADYEIDAGRDAFPVELQGVADCDIRLVL